MEKIIINISKIYFIKSKSSCILKFLMKYTNAFDQSIRYYLYSVPGYFLKASLSPRSVDSFRFLLLSIS